MQEMVKVYVGADPYDEQSATLHYLRPKSKFFNYSGYNTTLDLDSLKEALDNPSCIDPAFTWSESTYGHEMWCDYYGRAEEFWDEDLQEYVAEHNEEVDHTETKKIISEMIEYYSRRADYEVTEKHYEEVI